MGPIIFAAIFKKICPTALKKTAIKIIIRLAMLITH
jgi:hypothetical protein